MAKYERTLESLMKVAREYHAISVITEESPYGTFYDAIQNGKIVGRARTKEELFTLLDELTNIKKDELC